MDHAEIDAAAQGGDRAAAVAAVDIPGALPDHRDLRTVVAEFLLSHDHLATPMLVGRLHGLPRHCEPMGRRVAPPDDRLRGAIHSHAEKLDCFVAYAPRNDELRER